MYVVALSNAKLGYVVCDLSHSENFIYQLTATRFALNPSLQGE